MLSTLELIQAAALGTLLIYAYAAYSSLSIRRTLGVGPPRRQALGVALMAIAFALVSADSIILNPYTPLNPLNPIYRLILIQAFSIAGSVTLFYWVDSSMIVARRSDPHSRDTFRWSSLRKFLWGAIWTAIGISIANWGYLIASGTSPTFGSTSPSPAIIFLVAAVFVPFLSAAISGTVALPVVARRSKDATLRKHFNWFFLFAASLLASFIIPLILFFDIPSVSPIPIWGLANLVGGYCLYKSAKSLVPLHRFPAEDESTS